jgi:hypothetical protein
MFRLALDVSIIQSDEPANDEIQYFTAYGCMVIMQIPDCGVLFVAELLVQ